VIVTLVIVAPVPVRMATTWSRVSPSFMLFVVTANAGTDNSNNANPHTHERPGILNLPFA
jgi:hypothetical protein